MKNKNTRNYIYIYIYKWFQEKKIHFNHKCHYFHRCVLHVGIKSSTTISNWHSKQQVHVTHVIGVSFGNSKSLQTWC
jgi:hypothetical protein